MIVDAHLHLEPELSADRLLGLMDSAGVDRACLIAAAQVPLGRIRRRTTFFRTCMEIRPLRRPMYRLATRLRPPAHLRPDNEPVFAAARAHPDRFLAFAFVNPALDEAHDELDRRLAEGARGVKLHPWFHDYRLIDALRVLKRCEAAGVPVLAHLGRGPAADVHAALDACPRLKLILAHAGIPHFEQLWRLPRVLFDVASPRTLVSNRMIRRLVGAVGPERVVFASDGPTGLRDDGGYSYPEPPIPDRALGENLIALL